MSRSKRKWDHIQLALATGQKRDTGFNDIEFIHQSLPNIGIDQISLASKIGELSLSSPIFINAMTGGGGEKTLQLNRYLTQAAKEFGLAIAVGSQMSALKDTDELETYQIVRKENPNGIIIGNLGSEASVEEAKKAVDMLEADLLQIHLNVVQELTMPEGDRDFSGALNRIESIVRGIETPVIVKEVGFGMNREVVRKLFSVGVRAVDVGGFGGTNFAQIENNRRNRMLPFFDQWGIPTAIAIAEAKNSSCMIDVISSGGIQTSLEIAKALALGANAVGIAGYFLKILMKDGLEKLIEEIGFIHEELRFIMTALGAKSILELQKAPFVISGHTHHWLQERNINTKIYSQRNIHE